MGISCTYSEAELTDLVVAAQVEGGNGPAVAEILRRFEPLTKKLGSRYAAGQSHRDDVENAARYGLACAIQRHHGSAETFPAYAKRYMTGAASRELGRWLPPTATIIVPIEDTTERELAKAISVQMGTNRGGWGDGDTADVINTLDERRQRLLRRRYIDDAHLAELAAEAGTSVSAISQRLSTVNRQLRTALAA